MLGSTTITSAIKSMAFFVVTTLVSGVCFEIYLRATEISLPPIVVNHPRQGRVFKPNAPIMMMEEGLYLGATNAYGYLGHGYPPERQGQSLRVAVVGDSYVESMQLFEKFNFMSVLRRQLQQTTGGRVEVLNFGRSGMDLRTMYIHDLQLIRSYQPDLVLYVLSSFDFLDRDISRGPRCFLDDGQLNISFDFAESAAYQRSEKFAPLKNFAAFSLIRKAFWRAQMGETWSIVFEKLYIGERAGERVEQSETPRSEAGDPYQELNEAVIHQLARAQPSGSTRVAIVARGELPGNYRNLIQEQGLLFYDLSPVLEAMQDRGVNPYYWEATDSEGHWNHAAHAVIGQALAEAIAAWRVP